MEGLLFTPTDLKECCQPLGSDQTRTTQKIRGQESVQTGVMILASTIHQMLQASFMLPFLFFFSSSLPIMLPFSALQTRTVHRAKLTGVMDYRWLELRVTVSTRSSLTGCLPKHHLYFLA
ncbi:hypothetical protein BaRGS_00007809 [Batillaria attramentaria]|uniref:Uncharacterized protein n=1 Tax=Batillaria attramentaria TaxID=370345 RepID=A0ABD0LMT9_9CAEN